MTAVLHEACDTFSYKTRGSQAPDSRLFLPLTSRLTIVSPLCPRVENSHCFDDYQLRYRRRLVTRRHVFRTNPLACISRSSTNNALSKAHSFSMTPSKTDKSISPTDINSINLAPEEVNRAPLITKRCPNYLRFSTTRGTIEERILPVRKSQTAPSQSIYSYYALIGNPDYEPSPLSCPPWTTDVTSEPLGHAQPLNQRALRSLRRNARRAAGDIFFSPAYPEPTYDGSKTIQPTVLGSISGTHEPPNEHDFPAPKASHKTRTREQKLTIALPTTSRIPIAPRVRAPPANSPRFPRLHEPPTDSAP